MNATEELFRELDRRIESTDSPHSEESKERLRQHRVAMSILAAGDPERFEQACRRSFVAFGIKL